MSEIIPNQLYLGNVLHVNRLPWMNQHNINTIICVASKNDVTIQPEVRAAKTVHQFEILDNESQQLDFDRIVDLIDASLAHGAVLVNCAAGVSRSAACVIAYVMKTKNLSFEEAFIVVKRARPKINPNRSFMQQLARYRPIQPI
jgi:predicted protein tyrosine phosphatase